MRGNGKLIPLKHIFLLVMSMTMGCAFTTDWIYNGIMNRPPSQWTMDECRMIIGRAMAHNARDRDASIRVFAIPFSPLVITALNREGVLKKHLSDEEYQQSIQQEARECLGMYVDWKTDSYIDAQGRIFKDALQMDSLLFLITFDSPAPANPYINVVTGNGPVTSHQGVLGNPLNWSVQDPPDMVELAQKIALENDKGQRMKPRYVWMRHSKVLLKSESVLAMFDLRHGSFHFLEGTKEIHLMVTGFEKDVVLNFELSGGQFQALATR